MVVDWGTFTFYEDPTKLEGTFGLDLNDDGEITTLSASSTTTQVNSDTSGAQLRQTADGSLFIRDGSTTMPIVAPDCLLYTSDAADE